MNFSIRERLQKAASLLDQQDEDAALHELNEALTLDPKFADAYLLRGHVYRSLRAYHKALTDYEEAYQLGADRCSVYVGQGICMSKQHNHNQALQHFNSAISTNPACADAHFWRGRAYYELKQYHKALDDFNKALELQTVFPEAMDFRRAAQAALARESVSQVKYGCLGNFDNDGAMDLVAGLIDQFADKIQKFTRRSRPSLDYGEREIMPVLAIILLLCQASHVSPPSSERIAGWKMAYLKLFDASVFQDSEYKEQRRKVIVQTFDQLLDLEAESSRA